MCRINCIILKKMKDKFLKLLHKNNQFIKQTIKFVIAGSFNFLTFFIITNFLRVLTGINKGFGFNIIISIGFVIALIQSYYLNRNWTFKDNDNKSKKKVKTVEFSQFAIISFGGFIINNVIVYYITTIWGTHFGFSEGLWSNVAIVVGAGLSLVWNFSGYKFFVFRKRS
jgi:putative flippase GtrA